ncbi:unnamed protein product [Pleuronectes platessa]|uniref:Uncharacterized protein n=1 Tax=Pleuronectes platessa TaxID=8262 RepID=A0A9N7YK82_PLEPL|nr:unnamed protein product [Pleuronectes platessa]
MMTEACVYLIQNQQATQRQLFEYATCEHAAKNRTVDIQSVVLAEGSAQPPLIPVRKNTKTQGGVRLVAALCHTPLALRGVGSGLICQQTETSTPPASSYLDVRNRFVLQTAPLESLDFHRIASQH